MKLAHSLLPFSLFFISPVIASATPPTFDTKSSAKKTDHSALEELEKLAASGSASAQYALGRAYVLLAEQHHKPESYIKGHELLIKSANQDYADAQFYLGLIFLLGKGTEKDPEAALKWLLKAANQDVAHAQLILVGMYVRGEGTNINHEEAAKWARKAADQGLPKAQFDLAGFYARGEGVPKDLYESVKWYRKAAEQGLVRAQLLLGHMYSEGQGVPKDEIEGLAWINIAAASGDELAIEGRAIKETKIGREGTLQAQKRSREIAPMVKQGKTSASDISAP